MSQKMITVPKGKELHSVGGKVKYVGPCVVRHRKSLRLEPTFTDGTKWECDSDAPEGGTKKEVQEKGAEATKTTSESSPEKTKEEVKPATKKQPVKEKTQEKPKDK